MEMPGPWKAWKSKSSFSPLSTAPWESRQRREIPTFPQPGMPRMGKWKTKIRFPTFPRGACDDDRGLSVFRTKNQERRSARFAASSITFFRIHARLETELCFRIILRLENAPAAGSVLLLFPAVSLPQAGNVGRMVPPVPGVERQIGVQADQTELRMAERAGKIGVAQRFQETDPAGVQAIDELQRYLHRGGARIGQFGPGRLIVGPNGGLALGQRQTPAYVAVHVAVGDVMDGLADGPPFRAVRRIELRVVQPAHSVAVQHGGGGDLRDQRGVPAGRHGLLEIELADGIAQIHVPDSISRGREWRHEMDRIGSPARSPRLRGRTADQDRGGVRPLHPPDGAALCR